MKKALKVTCCIIGGIVIVGAAALVYVNHQLNHIGDNFNIDNK